MLAVVIADAAEGEFRFERRKFGTLGTDLDELSACSANGVSAK